MERKTGFRRSRSAPFRSPCPGRQRPWPEPVLVPSTALCPSCSLFVEGTGWFSRRSLCSCARVCARVRVLAASRWCRFIRGTAVCTSCALEAGSGCWTRFRFGYVATLLRVPGSFLAPPPVGRWWRLSAVSPTAAAQAPGVPGVVLRLPVLLSFSVGRCGAWSCGGRLSYRDPQSRRSVT